MGWFFVIIESNFLKKGDKNMNKIKVLIVDDNVNYCNEIKAELLRYGLFEVTACYDGMTALSECARLHSDVMILDLVMPNIDGMEVLKNITEKNMSVNVIAMSLPIGDEFITGALRAGAKFYMTKPVNVNALKNRILDLYAEKTTYTPPKVKINKSLDERLSNIFISVGIPAHIKGYQFLREAIKMAIENPDIINSITKRLYPEVADRFGTTASKVERAIRHAIEVAWNKGKIENINHLFGIKVYTSNDKPTNGEFIALVADKLIVESV